MTTNREPITPERLETLRMAAYRIRRNALREAEVQGEGYIGQALGLSDVLAALYVDQARIDPRNPEWEDRDRVLVSMGHYGLAIYAALVEIGMIPEDELDTYATDDSRLPMSAMASYTPGVEISGGSLGHGLVIANGIALGLKRKGNTGNVCYNVLSDGELDEGSTWEAAQTAAHFRLDNLIAIVDFNNQQADGRRARRSWAPSPSTGASGPSAGRPVDATATTWAGSSSSSRSSATASTATGRAASSSTPGSRRAWTSSRPARSSTS